MKTDHESGIPNPFHSPSSSEIAPTIQDFKLPISRVVQSELSVGYEMDEYKNDLRFHGGGGVGPIPKNSLSTEPIQWVPGTASPQTKKKLFGAEVKNSWSYPFIFPYTFMAR